MFFVEVKLAFRYFIYTGVKSVLIGLAPGAICTPPSQRCFVQEKKNFNLKMFHIRGRQLEQTALTLVQMKLLMTCNPQAQFLVTPLICVLCFVKMVPGCTFLVTLNNIFLWANTMAFFNGSELSSRSRFKG
jgi:hypothetical protein